MPRVNNSPYSLILHCSQSIVDVPKKSLINDPTIRLPGVDLPCFQWSMYTGSDQTRDHVATACMSGVTSPRDSATAVHTKQ